MKTIEYWESLLQKLEAQQSRTLYSEFKGGEHSPYLSPNFRPNVKGMSRSIRTKLISQFEQNARRARISASQAAKLPQRIAYAKERIAALSNITVFDRLRSGGLHI